jgi:hypothetical protein
MSTNSTAGSAAPLDPARASESRASQVTTTNLVCLMFALVLVALRIYTRLAIVRKRFWEDVVIVLAMVCSYGLQRWQGQMLTGCLIWSRPAPSSCLYLTS